jgi:predicted TIM-barrel fold metal-dependent hydrolase
VWIYFHQLAEVLAFANACPGLPIIINHCGGPLGIGVYAGRREEVLVQWRTGIERLGRCDTVSMKFGGLAMPLAGFGWRKLPEPPSSDVLAGAWEPYFKACVEAFGAERMMFESNFPVDRTGCTYTSLWNAFLRLSESLSADERGALFAGTAARIYRLDVPGISRD